MTDPNQGKTYFTYNDFGELEKETDANNVTVRYELDKLGRITSRLSPEGTASFVWDTVKNGLLSSESAPGINKTYLYDSSARPTDVTTTIDNTSSYLVKTQYDGNYGRPKALVYPNGLTVALTYTSAGYLSHEKNAASGYVYRHITAQDSWGNISSANLSDNKISGTYVYSQRTGQMLSSKVRKGSNNIHYLDYEDYDSYGNIKQQNNLVTGINATENFSYDSLHRLTQSTVSDVSDAGIPFTIDYAYDAVGNLTKKSDYSTNTVGAYQYVANSNKLSSVALKGGSSATFTYDNKGNLTHRNGSPESIYNAFNKPTSINKNGTAISLYYGADLARYKQVRIVDSKTITTHYIGKLYEVENDGTDITSKAYISDVAIVSQRTGNNSINFTHRDRLGSATTFTDHNGAVTAYRGYDPFGKPKGGDWSELGIPQLTDDITRRGFTDHEHLDEAELIHMNGRVYDYNVGRFMGVDPYIQAPGNSQSINPYSYIMNNPMAGTDPTGYISELTHNALIEFGEQEGLSRAEVDAKIGAALISAIETADTISDIAVPVKGLAKLGIKKLVKKVIKDNGANKSVKSKSGNTTDIKPDSQTPQQRGRDSEARVLKDEKLDKNNRKVSSPEGNSVPDSITATDFVEIKDTKRVSDTKQMRIQRDAAKKEGKEHTVITGKYTKVSKNVLRNSKVKRRSDLGPQSSGKSQGSRQRARPKLGSRIVRKKNK